MRPMKNMKRWKRLLAVGMCSAMMFSMSVGVSAIENQDTKETTVVETEKDEETTVEDEVVLKGDSGVSANVNDESTQVDKSVIEEAVEKAIESESTAEVAENQESDEDISIVENNDTEEMPKAIPAHIEYDGSQDLVFKFQDGVGDYAIKEIKFVSFLVDGYEGFDGIDSFDTNDFTYDVQAGELRVPSHVVKQYLADIGRVWPLCTCEVLVKAICQNGQEPSTAEWPNQMGSGIWEVDFKASDWSSNGDMPKFIDTSYEFDGTQDMEFNFENGTGDNEIVSVDEVYFPIQEKNATAEDGSYLQGFRIGNYGTSYNYDIAKGKLTLYKHAVSAIVYSDWMAVSNIYGKPYISVKLANGQNRTLFVSDGDSDWTVKILEKSPEATSQHVINITENFKEFNSDQMQNLIDINKTADVVLRNPDGITFTFAKGTMHMVDGKDGYPFGVEIIADFNNSGIKDTNVTSTIFACRINFEYSGELPGTAKISIPVDNKWNGQTLYYYQVMEDGTLKDTGKSGKVENGIFDVFQSHCSDYVLLAKSPKELGVTENTGSDNNNTGNNSGNNNNQTGNGNTQDSENNSNPQFKPADTTKTSPKTGDNNMILIFAILCIGSCIAGVSTLKARRRTR